MNLTRLTAELALYIRDDVLEAYSTSWLNDAILEIASDFELPDLRLREPTALTTTTANWLYSLPATYHKKLFKVRNENYDQLSICRDIQTIESIDYDHDETGDSVTNIAIEGVNDTAKIAIYPKANDTLYLWYYRLPVSMSAGTDEPDGIPPEYHERVIIPKVIAKNYRNLTDMAVKQTHQSIMYWEKKYKTGLYGEPGGDIGMINYFAKNKGVRKHGGRDPLP